MSQITIMKITGYTNPRQVANALYKLKKQGKIRNSSRGMYERL